MSAGLYGSVGGVNRKIKKLYANVGGVNREIKELWAVKDGVNRKIFSSAITWTITTSGTAGLWKSITMQDDGYFVCEMSKALSAGYAYAQLTFTFSEPVLLAIDSDSAGYGPMDEQGTAYVDGNQLVSSDFAFVRLIPNSATDTSSNTVYHDAIYAGHHMKFPNTSVLSSISYRFEAAQVGFAYKYEGRLRLLTQDGYWFYLNGTKEAQLYR